MSIVPLVRVTLCGLSAEKEVVLEELQRLGCLHLVSLRRGDEAEEPSPVGARDARRALRYLLDTPRKRHQLREVEGFDVGALVKQVLANKQRLRDVGDRRDFLAQRIRNREPWGDFHFPDERELRGRKLWFYVVPTPELRALDACPLPWQIVHREPRHAFVVVVSKDEPPSDAMPVPRTHTGSETLRELRRQLDQADGELDEVVAEREALTRFALLLGRNMDRAEDRVALRRASDQALDDEGVFAVQGWLPEPRRAALEAFADDRGLALLFEAPEPDDQPPTLLDNPESVAAGEDLVAFYQMPGYRTWDPSLVVYGSFAAFFAMIMADAGYALLLGALLALRWRRLGEGDLGRRMRVLGAWIVGLSLVYGALVGSYFGVSPAGGALGALAVLDLDDYDVMMRLSIGVGCAHLVLANGLMAWSAPRPRDRARPLAWIALIAAGFLGWLAETGVLPLPVEGAVGLAGAGLLTLLFFAGDHPVKQPLDALRRLGQGLGALTNVTKVFGDVLSYMRLWALGLASASLAVTFNQLARQVSDAMPGLGLLVSLLILVAGHGLNLALAIMSGLVHGLRLNFIEFFNWGMAEEGAPFRAFAKKEIES